MRVTEALGGREARQIAAEAYVFLYPLVMMDATRRQMTNSAGGERVGFGPTNAFTHMRGFPPPEFKAVPWANFDTLYSLAWFDLTAEPMIVSVPDTGGRYYLMPFQDMWTDVFAVPGKRTSGTGEGQFALVPPHWQGVLPGEVSRIDAPTAFVWLIARTQTNGPDDYAAVHQVQDGFTIRALSRWGQEPVTVSIAVDPTIDMTTPPVEQVNAMSGAAFFEYAAELMKVHPPHVTDWSTLARMRRIGLQPGMGFDANALAPEATEAVDAGAMSARHAIQAHLATIAPLVNGWQLSTETMGVYGNSYFKRAALAMIGLGSSPAEDSIYPLTFVDDHGDPLTGERAYVLHFEAGQTPPVDAFWSVTLYDTDGFQVPNEISRFALGDRDPLRYHPDGSLDIVIQAARPGPEQQPNWLPAPAGPFALFLRLYQPNADALNGRWQPPPVRVHSR